VFLSPGADLEIWVRLTPVLPGTATKTPPPDCALLPLTVVPLSSSRGQEEELPQMLTKAMPPPCWGALLPVTLVAYTCVSPPCNTSVQHEVRK
jgi:hypothetical protein